MATQTRREVLSTEAGATPLAFDGPDGAPALVALAHGAGGGMNAPFLSTVAAGLAQRGLQVCRFNFPYVERGRKAPDPQRVLEATWSNVLEHLSNVHEHLILGGKSMGGRVASQIVAAGSICDGLLFLGYPLHPPGRPEAPRRAHLHQIKVPMLFVVGTRDPLCSLDVLHETVRALPTPVEVSLVDDGDHSFKVRASSGRTTAQAWKEVTQKSWEWISRLLG